MIRKASEFDREVVPNMCGGEGDVVLDYAFHGNEITSKVTACCTVTLAPGASGQDRIRIRPMTRFIISSVVRVK